MHVVVPFDTTDPKTRLSPLLDAEERTALATAMCRDVLEAVRATGHEPTVLATAPVAFDAPVTVDDRPLSEAVNGVFTKREEAVAVVMADLALATPAALRRVFDAEGDVVFVPGRGGGTNVILARHPDFRVDYHGASIRDHRDRAAEIDAETTEVDSFRLATDVDEPEDLVEVLLHAEGEATDWLRDHGFDIRAAGGRMTVSREN